MSGYEMNAQAMDVVRKPDVEFFEVLDVHDGTQWWGFTNGPEPFTGKVLVGRTASSFFPFTPERVPIAIYGSAAFSRVLYDGAAHVVFATETEGGGVRVAAWDLGSLVPQHDAENTLWGLEAPFKDIAGVLWDAGKIIVLGRRHAEVWDGYRMRDASNPAWAIYYTDTGTWEYDYLDGTAYPYGTKFVQEGSIDPTADLYCARLYQGQLRAWRSAIADASTMWGDLATNASDAQNIIDSNVDGTFAIVYSAEANDCFLFYYVTTGWIKEYKYQAQTINQILETDQVLVGGGVLQTTAGEYKICAISSHGIKEICTGAQIPKSAAMLGAGALDGAYVRWIFWDSGAMGTALINIESQSIEQVSNSPLALASMPDRNFYIIYRDEAAEIWVSNNHDKAVLYKIDTATGNPVWAWSDWDTAIGTSVPGARMFPISTADSVMGVWAGAKAVLDIDLATIAQQTSGQDVTTYISQANIVDTGFSDDMGKGSPYVCQVKNASGAYVFPYMVYEAQAQTMSAYLATFSSNMTFNSVVDMGVVWAYDCTEPYPYPIDWHCSFLPAAQDGYFGITDLSVVGNAPLWCDISPWLLNENGVWSYYQQPDKMFSVSANLVCSELQFSRSTYPNGCNVAMYAAGDDTYRFFGADARGEIGFWLWKPGDDAPTEKTVDTQWRYNYSTVALTCTPQGEMVACFWEPVYSRMQIMRTSAEVARVSSAIALKVTTSDTYPNTYEEPFILTPQDAYVFMYASGQRAWFECEITGHFSVKGYGSGSVYEMRDYIPYPWAREGVRLDVNSLEKTTKITIPDTTNRDIRAMLQAGVDFRGKRCVIRRFFAELDPQDAGSSVIVIDGYIQDWAMDATNGIITFTVAHSVIDARNPFPPRLLSMNCGHQFKGTRCQYTGEATQCDHTKPTCSNLGNIARFGGFETVAARQRRILWR